MSEKGIEGSRESILGSVRRSLRRTGPLPSSVVSALDRRITHPTPNPRPTLAEDPIDLFMRKADIVHTKVSRAPDRAGVSDIVLQHIEEHDLENTIAIAPEISDLPWSNRLSVEARAATAQDRISVTGAFAGIAETGSVMLLSGAISPTTLNFLPDDHLVVLAESRIVPHLEDAWAMLRRERESMPRTVNLICGPSKTGDIEITILEGAHGPRRLHVILVRE
ncbi:LutC/YkgG family protein [Thioalkalivibrio sp. HK1]|uniref:LutC/YkgG family protein n=1 Tax=Thioalkalivibrio sp. HK1 TaxID=1469245 RepID=UPI00046FAC41|nr:lactate utilization protein C [Thioalkalivibrio sp. HK1]